MYVCKRRTRFAYGMETASASSLAPTLRSVFRLRTLLFKPMPQDLLCRLATLCSGFPPWFASLGQPLQAGGSHYFVREPLRHRLHRLSLALLRF